MPFEYVEHLIIMHRKGQHEHENTNARHTYTHAHTQTNTCMPMRTLIRARAYAYTRMNAISTRARAHDQVLHTGVCAQTQ